MDIYDIGKSIFEPNFPIFLPFTHEQLMRTIFLPTGKKRLFLFRNTQSRRKCLFVRSRLEPTPPETKNLWTILLV